MLVASPFPITRSRGSLGRVRGGDRFGPSMLGGVTIATLVVLTIAFAAVAGRKAPPPQAPPSQAPASKGSPSAGSEHTGSGHTPVTLCHATGSSRNPYVVITIDDDGVLGSSGGGNGHDGHARDIIPPFDYVDNRGVARSYPGKSWDAAGQAIFAHGCEVPPPPPKPPTPPPKPPPPPPKPPAPPPPSPSQPAQPGVTPPGPVIDLVVTKVDTPDPVRVGATLTYTITVTNRGPSTATNVRLADPLPESVTTLSVDSSRGSCAPEPVLSCSLGTLAPSEEARIVVQVRPTRIGLLVNTATAIGSESEVTPADNAATAVTTVVGAKKPTAKPKRPKKKPAVCVSHRVRPLTLRVGKPVFVKVTVTAGGRRQSGARVRVVGAGVRVTSITNRRGVAVIRVRATRSGFLRVSLPGRKTCRGVRVVGVTAPVLLPPVTG